MSDEQSGDAPGEVPQTSEQRLRALAGDRKRKVRGKAKPVQDDAQRRPGDVVDAVRERTGRDRTGLTGP
jgi:hypothetical protein